jgi:transaldolase / glucose-6-phosphate isomerase
VSIESLNMQRLNLGRQALIAQERGASMVSSTVDAIPFQSSHLTPLLKKLAKEGFGRRLWDKDGKLWKEDEKDLAQIQGSLGWLGLPQIMAERITEINDFVHEIQGAGFTHVVHMGMGGSSLAPLVFERLFSPIPPGLPVLVLDSTDPQTITRLEQRISLATTLFIIASKSGTTAEPTAFGDYFYNRLRGIKGNGAGENFIAITDPDTPLVKLAGDRGFRRIFLNFSDVGGRYSALSYMGIVPAALMGLNMREMITSAVGMAQACGATANEDENPGIVLGAIIGEMARMGRDKITFVMSPELSSLGMWMEQLIAESTGKEGTGILPIVGEPLGDILAYGNDRIFVHLYETGKVDPDVERRLRLIQGADLPVISIEIKKRIAIVQEFFRWEIATAVAGAVLGINPFDQPNVQEAKDATNRLLRSVEENGSLGEPTPASVDGSLSLFCRQGVGETEDILREFFQQGRPGDYLSIQAYIQEEEQTDELIEAIRLSLRDALRLATTIGYGPRLLHSTGQFHKGGPNNGLFIQLTARDSLDISVPGKAFTFGILKRAQALGDFEALVKHGRRVIRIDLGGDPRKGLMQLRGLVERTLLNSE